jgi:hypothetical protein
MFPNNFVQEGNWSKANLQDKNKQYRQYLYNTLESKREEQDINNERKDIKKSILEAMNVVIQSREKKKTYNEWWDDECQTAIHKINHARLKCRKRDSRMTQKEYNQERKYENEVCKRKEKRMDK